MTSTRWRAAAIVAPADITVVALATPAATSPSWPTGAVTAACRPGFHIRIRSARPTEGGSR
jgi:hypothetical protein